MTTLILSIILIPLIFYSLSFPQKPFKKELVKIREEQLKKAQQKDKDLDKLYVYLNLIINDKNIKIVRKYIYVFVLGFLFYAVSFSQDIRWDFDRPLATVQDFNGSWWANGSSYYLTINNEDFITYRFVPYEDEEGFLSWDRVCSPGKEVFIKKEGNVVVTNYWIDEQEYYVKVTYTLIGDQMKAEFNGKLKGEFYYNRINYKKLKFEDR